MNVNAYNHKHSGCFKARNTSTIARNEREAAIQTGKREEEKEEEEGTNNEKEK